MHVILTEEIIDSLLTERGGFTGATLNALGITGQPKKGWRRELVGTEISEEKLIEAKSGRLKLSRLGLRNRARADRRDVPRCEYLGAM